MNVMQRRLERLDRKNINHHSDGLSLFLEDLAWRRHDTTFRYRIERPSDARVQRLGGLPVYADLVALRGIAIAEERIGRGLPYTYDPEATHQLINPDEPRIRLSFLTSSEGVNHFYEGIPLENHPTMEGPLGLTIVKHQ